MAGSLAEQVCNTLTSEGMIGFPVIRLFDFALNVENEAEFQQKHQYKEFKAKYKMLHNGRQKNEQRYLINGLFGLKFHEECIYWCHKLFEDLRISDKEDRYIVFTMLSFSNYNLNNYEKTLEYGQKCLDLQLKKPDSQTVDILDLMCVSSNRLERYHDSSTYAREILKINVVRYNEKEIAIHDLLLTYSDLLDHQIKEKNMIGAKKTIKHLKIFNLKSMDPNDVLVSMDEEYEEGLKDLLPLGTYLSNDNLSDDEKSQHIDDFCNKNFSNKDDLKEFIVNLQTYHFAGKICWMKFLIYSGCDRMQDCEKWGHIHRNMIIDILKHMNILVNRPEANENFKQLQKSSNEVMPNRAFSLGKNSPFFKPQLESAINENFKQLQKSSNVVLPYTVFLDKMCIFKPLLESTIMIFLSINNILKAF